MADRKIERPLYCQYASGPCDQSFEDIVSNHAFFIYPSQPQIIADTIRKAQQSIDGMRDENWASWEDMSIAGKIIFCQICKSIRSSKIIIADVTTLNMNVLFEVGYAVGLEKTVIPIRDNSYIRDKSLFERLGILDTFGYKDFTNVTQLVDNLKIIDDLSPVTAPHAFPINRRQPIYVLKTHLETEGDVKSLSAIKKSSLRFRTYDPRETVRLSLHECMKEVNTSLGVVAHLIDENRIDALVQNARCAFVCGMAMALEKNVLMLQEGIASLPIDYRDVIKSYVKADDIPLMYESFIKSAIEKLQEQSSEAIKAPKGLLNKVDLGDVAAENEIVQLRDYFVETGDFLNVRRGRARLVVGNKGTGKTAIFYRVRDYHNRRHFRLVLDLKPEGHQFTKLRELVLDKLSPGIQGHTMTAFWIYLILMEFAHKIVNDEAKLAHRDPLTMETYEKVLSIYGHHPKEEQGDFSERLMKLVNSLIESCQNKSVPLDPSWVTETVYKRDLVVLMEALVEYLSRKDQVWLLIDNLDKGWPVRGTKQEDILILRSLLDASRKIQRQFDKKDIKLNSTVFVRYDIYEHLLQETPDRGKDPATKIYWNDPDLFKEIFAMRVKASTDLEGEFDDIWQALFEPAVNDINSFDYILARALGRPRYFLKFLSRCIEVAVNRKHSIISPNDVKQAEIGYSEDLLLDIGFELKDINEMYEKVLYSFIEGPKYMNSMQLKKVFNDANIPGTEMSSLIHMLIWFGFLGIKSSKNKIQYAYDVQHDINKLLSRPGEICYEINPAFWAALECS